MTKSVRSWLAEYGESHRNPINKAIHWICVPLIVLSLIGLLWSAPVPAAWAGISSWLNWATLLLAVAVLYYLVLSFSLAVGMLLFAAAVLATVWLMDQLPAPLWALSLAIFAAAWVGQFIGHYIEGRKPSFLKDIQFLMIGPMWLLAQLYERLGLRY
jgi:uncharacterized membrane protein YGL010W